MRRTAAVLAGVVALTVGAGGSAAAFYALTSTPATTTHDVATLGGVQGLTATPATDAVDLSWTAPAEPAGAAGLRYTVRRGTAVVCEAVTAPACRDAAVTPGATHTYAVQPVLGAWTGPALEVSATVPAQRALAVLAPAEAVAGEPVTVTLEALNGSTSDPTALGTRTLTVTGAGVAPGGAAPDATVSVTFTQQGAGVRATATLTLVKAETATLTFTDPAVPDRTGTSAPVVVGVGAGTTSFVDCTGRAAGYACGSTAQLNGSDFTAVLTRTELDGFGNPVELGETPVAITHDGTTAGTATPTVAFPAGALRSEPVRYTPARGGSRAVITLTATPASGWSSSTVALVE